MTMGHAAVAKLGLFTDTFEDVNGVARFLRDMLAEAHKAGKRLCVATCCARVKTEVMGRRNFAPLYSARLPYYPEMELNLPPALEVMQWAQGQRFDAVHVSTPGPMGLCGLL